MTPTMFYVITGPTGRFLGLADSWETAEASIRLTHSNCEDVTVEAAGASVDRTGFDVSWYADPTKTWSLVRETKLAPADFVGEAEYIGKGRVRYRYTIKAEPLAEEATHL